MVAKTPAKQRKTMYGKMPVTYPLLPLSPTQFRETLKKVDQCMARLQELQYTVTGGSKVVSGVKLSPKTTQSYLKTSFRCKQESIRIRNNCGKKSPPGKLPATKTGEWRRMSLSAMLVGETVAEIIQATRITKTIMEKSSNVEDPKTPLPLSQKQRKANAERTPLSLSQKQRKVNQEKTPLEVRRKREKQHVFHIIRAESNSPKLRRARSKINFKVSSPKNLEMESGGKRYIANRVSPKHKPWARKTVLFPNPLFDSEKQEICKKKREIPHKFVVKSPVKIKSPQKVPSSSSPVSGSRSSRALSRKSPPKSTSTVARLRRSLSPSRLANRFVSPLKGRRNSMHNSVDNGDGGLKQRLPALMMMPMRFAAHRIPVGTAN